ncbi:MAG: alpha/beta hydrolase-fold protein [Bacteroidota bacterium]
MPRLLLLCALLLTACSESSTITFEIDMRPAIRAGWFNPDTDKIGVRGSSWPLAWDKTVYAADPNHDGVYNAPIRFQEAFSEATPLEYKFITEGEGHPNGGWETDRNRFVTVAQGTIARAFNAPPPALEPTFTGTVETHDAFASAHLARDRALYVYLPPGYAKNPEQRYPVLYMHDGQNVFDKQSVGNEWGMDETAERLITAGQIEPVIIVGIANTADRTPEYTPTTEQWHYDLERTDDGGAADGLEAYAGTYIITAMDAEVTFEVEGETLSAVLPEESEATLLDPVADDQFRAPRASITFTFLRDATGRVTAISADKPDRGGLGPSYARMLIEEVKPFIDQTYRTLPDQAHTSVGGASLGGLISLYLGLEYPNVFGGLLVASPSVWWDGKTILDQVRAAPKANQRIWVDMGTKEGGTMLADARTLRDELEARGWSENEDLRYVEEATEHNEAAWAGRAEGMLRFLYGTE